MGVAALRTVGVQDPFKSLVMGLTFQSNFYIENKLIRVTLIL